MSPGCERVLERLSPYLDGELPDGDYGEIRAHLGACPPCEGAHRRLLRLEELSVSILRGAPIVSAAEWGARWSRIDAYGREPRVVARRERSVRRSMIRFALAAALLVAATLSLPLLHGSLHEREHGSHLCYSTAPGANQGEIVEAPWTDSEEHGVWIDNASDPVVITVERF